MSKLYEALRGYTMVPEKTFEANLELARYAKHADGSVVECGVWKGGMAAAITATVGIHRRSYLFDSFDGLPPPTREDGPAAFAYQADKDSPSYHDNCRADMVHATEAMRVVGATKYTIFKGWFTRDLLKSVPGSIALLRIDCDWYEPTKLCLESLWDKVSNHGVVILDDYFAWEGCKKAVDKFFESVAEVHVREEDSLCWVVK